MKSFAKLAFAGVAGVALLKLVVTLLIPLLGMALGLIALTLKVAVLAAVLYFLYGLVRKRDPINPDGEIVVEPRDPAHASDEDGSAGDNS